MKITAGISNIDDYVNLVKAGVDEVFCGYVPYEWNKKYKTLFPLNRREVLYYNVQIGSFEDMKILAKMMQHYKVPVSITLNYLYYVDKQYEEIALIIKSLMDIGFTDFIIGDLALIIYLQEQNIKCNIHLSGECSELNKTAINFFNRFSNISRFIFHRKNTLSDIKSCINIDHNLVLNNNNISNREYEAFMLNEMCHYTGAYCSSLHCDEFSHICKLPYELMDFNEADSNIDCIDKTIEDLNVSNYDAAVDSYETDNNEMSYYLLGETGCGLCALKSLRDAGITHLKVVGRGLSIEDIEKDVRNLKLALKILEENPNITDQEFKVAVQNKFFKNGCSGKCYYKFSDNLNSLYSQLDICK